jgi:hypothetical protein
VSPRQWQRDPLVEWLVNAAIGATRRSLGLEAEPGKRPVRVDPALDRQRRPVFLGEVEIRLSTETCEALKRLFYAGGFRWTETDPARARQSAQALDALHDSSLACALGESDVPRPDQPAETGTGYRLRTGAREGFARHTRADWLHQLGVTKSAPDVAELPRSPAHPTAGRTAEAVSSYLAERRGVPAADVLRDLTRAGEAAPAYVAQHAIEGYDPRLWAHVQGLDQTRREAVLRGVVAPLENAWRGEREDRTSLAGVGAAVGIHQAVLEVAEEAGLRRGAAAGTSLDREKAEYRVDGAYIAWAKSSGAARAWALAGRVAARASLAAVAVRERGEAVAGGLGSTTATVGRGLERAARTVTSPVAEQLEQARSWTRAERSRRARIKERQGVGEYGF